MALSKEDNELLTRTGAGTLMGDFLRRFWVPALLPEDVTVVHKTGSLDGVANDVGVVEGNGVAFAIAFLTDGQADTARTSNDIAACSLAVWNAIRSTGAKR